MATKARAVSASVAQTSRSPQGIMGQIAALLTQPKTFFRSMPQGRHWLWIAGLVLAIFGFAASNQGQPDTTTDDASQSQGFNLTLLQDSTTTPTTNASAQPAATQSTTNNADTNTVLMSALQAASSVLIMWAGQVVLLCLIPMQKGHPPKVGHSLQIAVWASLPLALMLGLRQIYFAAGGTGGAVGLSLLLEKWDHYASLSSGAQRLLAAFMSNITVFWVWSLLLLYYGARHTLGGKYWVAALVIMIWIAAVPAVTVLVSDPVTTVSPRATTPGAVESQSDDETGTSSPAASQPFNMGGGFPSGGGEPPSGDGMPQGGGRP